MKNIIIILFVLISFNSCEENPIIYEGKPFVAFTSSEIGRYYVLKKDDEGYEIQIGVTETSSSDRSVSFSVSGDATEGEQYSLSSSTITIPAGKYTGSLKVNGLFDGFTGQVDTLIITLTGAEVADFDNSYTLIMQRLCPFDINDFVGVWNVVDFSEYYGESTYDVTIEIEDEATKTMVVKNLWQNTPNVYISFDDSEPANLIFKIADQFYATHPTEGEIRITEMTNSSFSSCEMVINTVITK